MTVEQIEQAMQWSVAFLMLAMIWAIVLAAAVLVVVMIVTEWRQR